MNSVRRAVPGALVALGGIALLSAVMVPLRHHLSPATPALILVVPVAGGVALGGLTAGVVAVLAGFCAYDLLFIPPYGSLAVGTAQDWVALAVYVVVMLVVAGLASSLQRARAEARRHEVETRRLYVLSDLLIGEHPADELLQHIVSTIHQAFRPRWAAALLPEGDSLAVVATAGEPLTTAELRGLAPAGGRPESLRTGNAAEGVVRVALSARGGPIGLVAMACDPLDAHDWELLRTYANQAALALERSQLRQQALRTELLEEVDRWRAAMMGAVSHDLRTPLASVKTAVSTLRHHDPDLGSEDRSELLELIETQSDALDRLVANLLDVTRIQSGALELRRDICPVSEIVDGALRALRPLGEGRVVVTTPPDLPLVDVDQLLIEQVLANLIENAVRHSPEDQPVEVTARRVAPAAPAAPVAPVAPAAPAGVAPGPAGDGRCLVEVGVRDHGPGVPAGERDRVFQMFNRVSGGGRAGLGLAIAKAFVEAHGQAIRVGDAPGGGAEFLFTLPVADIAIDAA
jgi:two-component system sensor histidine kinase KdpD